MGLSWFTFFFTYPEDATPTMRVRHLLWGFGLSPAVCWLSRAADGLRLVKLSICWTMLEKKIEGCLKAAMERVMVLWPSNFEESPLKTWPWPPAAAAAALSNCDNCPLVVD